MVLGTPKCECEATTVVVVRLEAGEAVALTRTKCGKWVCGCGRRVRVRGSGWLGVVHL